MPISKGRKKPAKRTTRKTPTTTKGEGIALYHLVKANETFDDAAEMLLQIVQLAAREHPGQPRHLYLDIDGHRNEEGGWDHDMFELYKGFILGYLGRWLTSASLPHTADRVEWPSQREDVPKHLIIAEAGPRAERKAKLARDAKAQGVPVFDADTGNLVHPDGTITPADERP